MVEFVRYPGDSEHPQIDIAQKQMDNPGHMIYFDLKTAERAKAFMSLLRYFRTFEHAVSLGDVRNLMQMPGYGALSNLSDEQLKEGGVTRGGIRWSVGIEDAQDVLRELDAIFKILQLYDNQLDEIPYGDLDNIFMQPSMDLSGKAIYFLRKFPVVERASKEYRVEPKIAAGIETLATRRARELATLLNEATLITRYNPHTLLIHHTGVWGLLSGDHHSLVASNGLSNAFRAFDPDDLRGKFGYAGEAARSQSLPKGSYEGYGRFGTPGSATVQILLALAEAGAQSAFSFEHQGVSVPSFESAVDLLLDNWAIDAPKKTNGASKRIVVVTQDNSPLKRLVEKYRGDNRQILDFSQNGAGVKIVVVNAYDEKTFQSSLTADTDFVLVDEQIFDVDAISYIKNRTGNAKVAWVNSQGIKQGVHPLSAGADITILNITDNGKSAGAALVVPQADVEPLLTRRNYSSIVNRNSEEILVHLFPYLLLNGQPHSPDVVQAPVDDDLGGISLDSRRLNLRVKVDNQGAPLPAQLQNPQLLAIPGFLPVIRAITPMRLQQ